MPAKKTIKKTTPKTTRAVNNKQPKAPAPQMSMLSWFFRPDLAQGSGKWIMRAALFTIGLFATIIMLGAIMISAAGLATESGAPSFWGGIQFIANGFMQKPTSLMISFMMIFVIGVFAFMPRKSLDRLGFTAISWTSLLWIFLSTIVINAVGSSHGWVSIFAIIIFGALIGLCAATVCHARSRGVSPLVLFLSFPFGADFYGYSGYFLPDDMAPTISLQYNWYNRMVNFMLNDKRGQMALAGICAVSLAFSFTPWMAAISAFFVVLYFWRGSKWMAQNIRTLSWFAAAANITAVTMVMSTVIRILSDPSLVAALIA